MTPIELRNSRLAARLVERLKRRGMAAHYCATAAEAVECVQRLIADGSSVSWGGSMTLREMGLPAALHARGTLRVLDRDRATGPGEQRRIYEQALAADVYLTSANAITEDGVIVNIDGNGNRVAAITWGPRQVVLVVSLHKVAPTVEAAVARARHTAAPLNTARLGTATPCVADGVCHDCLSPDCICNHVHLLRHSPRSRHTVVLVGESLGY